MKEANQHQKQLVLEILMQSFVENQSVNYIIQKGSEKRLAHLMSYSYDICERFGKVYLSDDEKACALILFPDQKKLSFWSVLQDVKLILFAIGLTNIRKALKRESLIQKKQFKGVFYYICFIGVLQEEQGKGIGGLLLKELLSEAVSLNRIARLETSTLKNIPWYRKFGFKIYEELEFSYKLYFLIK